MEENKQPQEQDLLMDLMETLADFTQAEPKDEEARINRLKLFGIWYFAGFLIFFGILALLSNFIAPVSGMVFVSMVAAVLYIKSGGNRYAKKYGDALKARLLRQMFEEHFTKVRIRNDLGLPIEYVKEKALLQFTEKHYRSNDFLSANYHDVPFRRADVYAAMTDVNQETKEKHTYVFEGRWIVLYLKDVMPVDIIIHQKGFDAAIKHIDHEQDGRECNLVKTGNKDFDEDFDVCSSKPEFAKEFLTEDKLEKIRTYCDLSDGNVLLAYKGRELHVLIDSDENAMEPDPYSKTCEEELKEEIEKEIAVIEKTVDMLF